tara:strand:- start:267 stop:827 length:561 start_codon:yes stop_codon:yes gene_type:complete
MRKPNQHIRQVEREVLDNLTRSRITTSTKQMRSEREKQLRVSVATRSRQLVHAATRTGIKVPEHFSEGLKVVHGIHGRGTILSREDRLGAAGVVVKFDCSNSRGARYVARFTFGSHRTLHIAADEAYTLPPTLMQVAVEASTTRSSSRATAEELLGNVEAAEAGLGLPSNAVAPSPVAVQEVVLSQ